MLKINKYSFNRLIQPLSGWEPLSSYHAFHAWLMTFNPYRDSRQNFEIKRRGQSAIQMSYDIITKGHGGNLELESEINKGTEFKISIPC